MFILYYDTREQEYHGHIATLMKKLYTLKVVGWWEKWREQFYCHCTKETAYLDHRDQQALISNFWEQQLFTIARRRKEETSFQLQIISQMKPISLDSIQIINIGEEAIFRNSHYWNKDRLAEFVPVLERWKIVVSAGLSVRWSGETHIFV